MTWFVAGDATAVTDGQRLRIRVYFDDAPGVAMGASSDMTFYWAGTSAAASGDTYITLPQTVTEFAPEVLLADLRTDADPAHPRPIRRADEHVPALRQSRSELRRW